MKRQIGNFIIFAALILTVSSINTTIFAATEKKDDGTDGTQGAVFDNRLDYFGNGLSDWMMLKAPSGGAVTWNALRNDNPTTAAGTILSVPFGASSTDALPAFGNYSGNGRADFAVVRLDSQFTYYTYDTNTQGVTNTPWGTTNDIIGAEGDYDNDGKMDFTVIRNENPSARWYILRSSDSTFYSFTFGNTQTDLFLAGADYTGDGQDDPTVCRIAASGAITWFIGNSNGLGIKQVSWGDFNTDFIVPAGDYNGDGKADFMVWRGFGAGTDGKWYLLDSEGNASATAFGIPGGTGRDTALRSGDYDGDGKTDLAVYRTSAKTFFVRRSSNGQVMSQGWGDGASNSFPVASFGIF